MPGENPTTTIEVKEHSHAEFAPVICPSCGAQTELNIASAVTPCEFCQSTIRPNRESLQQFHAAKSKLPHACLYVELETSVPWLSKLIQDAEMKEIDTYSTTYTRSDFHKFGSSYAVTARHMDKAKDRIAAKNSITKKLQRIGSLVRFIESIPEKKLDS
jgi:hypothetical protein